MFTSQSSSDQASEIASVGSLHGLQVVTGQPCADTSTWKITEWEEWLNHIKFHLDGFHAAYIPALEHPEAPRRSITDPLVIGALNCFATDRGNQATYSIETELYNQATVPKHTIGWGPLDYLLESRVVLCESVQVIF